MLTRSSTIKISLVSLLAMAMALTAGSLMAAEAADDSYSVEQGGTLAVAAPGVLENDCCPSRDPITAVLVEPPTSGTLDLAGDGGFTYAHDGGGSTSDTFTYQAEDSGGLSNIATVTISVLQGSQIEAGDDFYEVEVGQQLVVNPPGVLGNDTDPEGDPLTAVPLSTTSAGTLNFNSDGSFTYDHASTGPGEDSFTYEATDGTNTSDPATVSISVVEASVSAGTVIVNFPSVGTVGVSRRVDQFDGISLSVTAEAGTTAQVQGSGMPTQTVQLVARVLQNNRLETGRQIFSRCERLALVAQARPTKYDFTARFELDDVDAQASGDTERVSVNVSPATMHCDLIRPAGSDGGDGGDGGDDGGDDGRDG